MLNYFLKYEKVEVNRIVHNKAKRYYFHPYYRYYYVKYQTYKFHAFFNKKQFYKNNYYFNYAKKDLTCITVKKPLLKKGFKGRVLRLPKLKKCGLEKINSPKKFIINRKNYKRFTTTARN